MGGATELMTPTHRTFSSLRRPLNHTIPPRHHPSDGERWERHGRFWRRHQRGGWQWNTDPVGRDGVAQPPGADCLQYGGTFERMGPSADEIRIKNAPQDGARKHQTVACDGGRHLYRIISPLWRCLWCRGIAISWVFIMGVGDVSWE
jgi:hypothetical protein